ncbi:MAG: hypothetical protein AABW46_00640 [Nanoarchaeota archaeon]
MAFIQETVYGVTSPLGQLWGAFVNVLPSIIVAIIVLLVGAFVAAILGHALRILLDKFRLDEALRRAKLTKAVGHTDVPALLGELLKWWIIIIALQVAVSLLNLGSLSDILGEFVFWLPKLLVAVVIMLLGLAAAHYVEIKIGEHTKMKGMRLTATILKWIIIILVTIQALGLIGLDVGLFENLVLYVIIAFAAGIALALGIALGLGLRKEAENVIRDVKKNL